MLIFIINIQRFVSFNACLCLVHTLNSPGKKFQLRSSCLRKQAFFSAEEGLLDPMCCSLAFICSRSLEQWVFGQLVTVYSTLCDRSISAAYHVRSFFYLAFLQSVCKWVFIMHEKSLQRHRYIFLFVFRTQDPLFLNEYIN